MKSIKKYYKMARSKYAIATKKTIYIDVPVEQLWEITALNFADIGKWSAGVKDSTGSGSGINGSTCTERVCQPNYKGIGKTTEKFIKYDPDNFDFSYQIISGLPKFVTYAKNNWTHGEKGEGTELTMGVNMELTGLLGWLAKGFMKKNMSKILQKNLEELKMYAETGELHPRKIKANEKNRK